MVRWYLFFRKRNFYEFTEFELPENRDRDSNLLLRLLKNIWRNVKITFPYFLLGVLLTALYQRYIPSQWVSGLFGSNRGLGALMAAALGVPLYTCGGGTIPLISTWLAEGMSKGSAMAFMIAGPATARNTDQSQERQRQGSQAQYNDTRRQTQGQEYKDRNSHRNCKDTGLNPTVKLVCQPIIQNGPPAAAAL